MEISILVESTKAVPVVVTADPDAQAGQLVAALAGVIGTDPALPFYIARNSRRIDSGTTLSALGLRNGDRLVVGAVPPPRGPRSSRELLIVGGPHCGERIALPSGTCTLGRSPESTIVIDDPLVSWEHATLSISDEGIQISDVGSTNGTRLNEGWVGRTKVPFPPGAVALLGATALSVAGEAPTVDPPYGDGRLLFNRPPRVARPALDATIALPDPPRTAAKRRLPLATALVPLVLGVGLAVFLGQPEFLLMALLSPAMAVFSVIEDRRSGRTSNAKSRAVFDGRMTQARLDATAAHAQVIQHRREATPDPATLAARSVGPEATLWERRPSDSDFLLLRVGVADQTSLLSITGGQPAEAPPPGAPPSEADTLRAEHGVDALVPVVVALRQGVLGIAGQAGTTEAVARSLVLQAATMHSPRDLLIAILVPEARLDAWRWAQWLPHTEGLVPGGRSVAAGPEDARALLAMIDDMVVARLADGERRGGSWLPHVLLVLGGGLDIPAPTVARVLSEGPRCSVSCIALADIPEHLPGDCSAVATVAPGLETSRLVLTASGAAVDKVTPDLTTVTVLSEAALALAAMRDITARGGAGDLPSGLLLLDLLGMVPPTPDAVLSRWAGSRGSLAAPLGAAPGAMLVLDLRRDGPHALVAGTTGAGKSELLQTWVASMATNHPPNRLNFVLVDYKGGAAFKDCVDLPHVVGFFTDLDGHLAHRALESLNAELRRREEILRTAGAKDLVEFERRDPAAAPASLVIVFDEFAFLKKEVPEFVDGVVDIAQRGRSLGVHLVLATQRPTGVVDDKIRANVTLRIALRVSDDGDSNDVIGRPDAARIPKTLPGRAFVRTGEAQIQPVQTAYVGATRPQGTRQPQVRVRPMPFGPSVAASASGEEDDQASPTDLQVLVRAITEAGTRSAMPAQPRPWLDPLQGTYPLTAVRNQPTGSTAWGSPSLATVIGVVDEPSQQRQRPWKLDLERSGHLLVYGASGAGKTTFLRTLAAGLALSLGPEDLHLYGLDFASRGLQAIAGLPQCGGVVMGDEIERVQRLFAVFDDHIARRQARLGAVGAGSLSEYRQRAGPGESLPWVVLLLDGFGGFASAFEDVDHGELIDRLCRLAAEGRAVGVHLVITAGRRSGIPAALTGAIADRLVLRMADEDEYAWLGVGAAAKGAVLPPGRGFLPDGTEIQICCLSEDPSGHAQSVALAALAGRLPTVGGSVPPVEVLPEMVARAGLPVSGAGRSVVLGLDGATMAPAVARLGDVPTFLVCGPDRSGRSTALLTLAAGLVAADPSLDSYLLAPRRSPLLGQPWWKEAARGPDACAALAQKLADELRSREPGDDRAILVVVDDGDELTEGRVATNLEAAIKRGRDAGLIFLTSAQTHAVHRAFANWLTETKKAKHGFVLAPDVEVDGDIFGARLPRRSVRAFPPGRGYLILRGAVTLVQVAS
jgi:S-DNA-T family DNA segregation ATPase FtsK/SpoIIIE